MVGGADATHRVADRRGDSAYRRLTNEFFRVDSRYSCPIAAKLEPMTAVGLRIQSGDATFNDLEVWRGGVADEAKSED